MRQALEAEDAARASRGLPPMSARERERFLKLRRRGQHRAPAKSSG
jgi:hypothetical protein